jgi:hypothetical protein
MMIDALVGHLVGDYILQNDWMAGNKKSKIFPCIVHCFIWTLSVCAFGKLNIAQGAILFITHFLQDNSNVIHKTMGYMGQEKFRDGPCSPWSMIVVDNVFHILTIWMVIHSGLDKWNWQHLFSLWF